MVTWLAKPYKELSKKELYSIIQFRINIFMIEQKSIYEDLDSLDQKSIHFLAMLEDKLIAYGRVHINPENKFAVIRRICVHRDHRSKKLGGELMKKIMTHIDTIPGLHGSELDAQHHLQNFYKKFGFYSEGAPYDDGGVLHIRMIRHQKNIALLSSPPENSSNDAQLKSIDAMKKALLLSNLALCFWNCIGELATEKNLEPTFSSMLGYHQHFYYRLAILELSKIYDNHEKSTGISKIIDTLSPDNKIKVSHIVDRITPKIKKLKEIRNKYIAHNDNIAINGNKVNFGIDQIESVIKETKALLEQLSEIFGESLDLILDSIREVTCFKKMIKNYTETQV